MKENFEEVKRDVKREVSSVSASEISNLEGQLI